MTIFAFVHSITCHDPTGGNGDDEMAAYFSFSDTAGNSENLKVYEEDMDCGSRHTINQPGLPNITHPLGREHGRLLFKTTEDQINIRTRGTEIDGRDSNIEKEFQDFLNNTIEFDQDNFLWFNEFEITKDRLLALEAHEDRAGAEILSERIEGPRPGSGDQVDGIRMNYQILVRVFEDSRFTRNRVIEFEIWSENSPQGSLYDVKFRFAYVPTE